MMSIPSWHSLVQKTQSTVATLKAKRRRGWRSIRPRLQLESLEERLVLASPLTKSTSGHTLGDGSTPGNSSFAGGVLFSIPMTIAATASSTAGSFSITVTNDQNGPTTPFKPAYWTAFVGSSGTITMFPG